jgi:hypothetical protein
LLDMDESRGEWLDQAGFTLLAAEDLLVGGISEEAINSSFLAMVYAARAALEGSGEEISGWEEVVRRFQDALPALGLSKENQRALPIVADLYRRIGGGEVEADPVTAAACLEDARSFVAEITTKMQK